jgi:hypothetical protein
VVPSAGFDVMTEILIASNLCWSYGCKLLALEVTPEASPSQRSLAGILVLASFKE